MLEGQQVHSLEKLEGLQQYGRGGGALVTICSSIEVCEQHPNVTQTPHQWKTQNYFKKSAFFQKLLYKLKKGINIINTAPIPFHTPNSPAPDMHQKREIHLFIPSSQIYPLFPLALLCLNCPGLCKIGTSSPCATSSTN
jgi:hypothetical protein